MKTKFYLCPTCGNIVCKVVDSGVTPVCCGSEMMLLLPKKVDNGREKHLPVVECIDADTIKVKVGEVPHPCTPEHHIVMIALQLKNGIVIKTLDPTCCKAPEAVFKCCRSDVIGVYEYCNLHGLWYKELE